MTDEEAEVLGIFNQLLKSATCDGGQKRRAGLKSSWKVDTTHEAALFSHLNKWKHKELEDTDSGAHPLVHLAWRALAIAWQEMKVSTLALVHYSHCKHCVNDCTVNHQAYCRICAGPWV